MSRFQHFPAITSTILSIALGLALSVTCQAAEVRVRNDTGEDLRNVVVGPVSFGNLGTGQTSQYRSWESATDVARASARSMGGVIGFWPKKPELLQSLGQGRFTYVLTRANGGLAVRAERDPG